MTHFAGQVPAERAYTPGRGAGIRDSCPKGSGRQEFLCGREAAPSMSVRVAVSDPLPMFRQGVMACLDDMSVEAELPTDLRTWAYGADRRVILLTVQTAADWDLLADL